MFSAIVPPLTNGSSPEAAGDETPPSALVRSKPRVLVLDDDSSQRELIRSYLQDEFEIVTCASADVALGELTRRPVDLVLCDIYMPGTDGLCFHRQLSARGAHELLPFIFMTGVEDEKLQGVAVSLGIDDLLLKPLRKRALRTTIHRVLARHRVVRERLADDLATQLADTLRPRLPPRLGSFAVTLHAIGHDNLDIVVHRREPSGGMLLLGRIHSRAAHSAAALQAAYLAGLAAQLSLGGDAATLVEILRAQLWSDCVLGGQQIDLLLALTGRDGRLDLAGSGATGWARVGDGDGKLNGLRETHGTTLRPAPGERIVLCLAEPDDTAFDPSLSCEQLANELLGAGRSTLVILEALGGA
ncbi:response regulator receiver domain-containing protein [Plasticicumulans acidivorans]|uniref:Response regulator receiver domain-containing protein n=1 Tax=Plasticicumulans acidivorans TaxID=886464 RepID=A0A317MQQ7_9GAMM|nr:response regulator receiver domain-containing protein [Plasticicumulans acidivorans]